MCILNCFSQLQAEKPAELEQFENLLGIRAPKHSSADSTSESRRSESPGHTYTIKSQHSGFRKDKISPIEEKSSAGMYVEIRRPV